MTDCAAQPFSDSPPARQELAEFLARHLPAASASQWNARFSHWWDQNPFANLVAERGWVLRARATGQLAGFLGLIPACYAKNGAPVPAVTPTTWVVDPRHRLSAPMLGRRLGRLEGRVFIVCTTARKDFQARLIRRGWVSHETGTRQFIPCGPLAQHWLGRPPRLPKDTRLTFDASDVLSIERPFQFERGIEKWITTESLRWYLNSPARRHRFAGIVDAAGCLSAFLILAPEPVCGLLHTWSVVDWFGTPRNRRRSLQALLTAVASNPAAAGLDRRLGLPPLLLRLTATAGDDSWADVRGMLRASIFMDHLHLPPWSWPALPKHCVPAEGDLGL